MKDFLWPGGSVKSVDVYLSDFGRERLAEEDVLGPQELREAGQDRDNDGIESFRLTLLLY